MDLAELDWGDMDWVELSQDRNQCVVLVTAEMNTGLMFKKVKIRFKLLMPLFSGCHARKVTYITHRYEA
jgi:hypothetical protein